jgi:Ser/Thr protein kinase RdoA (MazF antagonist)
MRHPAAAHGDDALPGPQVIPAALAAGALTAADVVHAGVQVDDVGRSHPVYRVSVGGQPRFYLKVFGPSRGATDGRPERELAVLRLAAEHPAVAALVPGEWRWDHDPSTGPRRVVATRAVAGVEAWTLDRAGAALDDAWRDLVAALVPPLAGLHRATRHLARPGAAVPAGLEPAHPWALRLMDGDAAPELWASPVLGALLREAAAAPVVAGVRAARAAWRPMALVHADLKHDNVLVDPATTQVHVVDWEMARIGDPAWDLAGLTARLLVARDAEPWSAADVAAAKHLLAAYRAATGLALPALAHRLVLFTGTVLLATALQYGSTLPAGTDPLPVRQIVRRACVTLTRAPQLTAELIEAVGTEYRATA